MTNCPEQVILVIGACALDRLLTVSEYPRADEKVRSTAYHEIGGGNAANSAHTMALLARASLLKGFNITIKLLTKIGDDAVGRRLVEELRDAGVNISSPLFLVGANGSSTAFTTVIVSKLEHTRTCIYTPGTCGELVMKDLAFLDMDTIFANVVHLHSDSRHTNVALALAREARHRGITVSVDAEKDRRTKSMDDLIDLATILFTNSTQLEDYFARRRSEKKEKSDELTQQIQLSDENSSLHVNLIYKGSVAPSRFFSQWYGQSSNEKEVVMTKGSLGALHITCCSSHTTSATDPLHSLVKTPELARHSIRAIEVGGGVERIYTIHSTGVLGNINIVDATGAGDAFIGAYLLSQFIKHAKSPIQFRLNFGSWVGGRKLQGPGARSALPTGADVDTALGKTTEEIETRLSIVISRFGTSMEE